MPTPLPASLINLVLGLELGSTAADAGNRVSLEGLTFGPGPEGVLEIRIDRFEAASLRLVHGPLVVDVGSLVLHELSAQARFDTGRPRLIAMSAGSAELSGVKVQAPLIPLSQAAGAMHASNAQSAAPAWNLGALAAADGSIRAKIVDAHALFDADVTVPIRKGEVDFSDATVEHVGPDSRMGVSPLGVYVDAPNGRSFLYQFASTPVAGVEYERRDALLGPWVSDRGKLKLQAFGEALLSNAKDGQGLGVTRQARELLGRTSVAGDVQLGDGRLAAPGVQAETVGRAGGHNAVRLQSDALGRGLIVELASMSLRSAVLKSAQLQLGCAEIAAALRLRVVLDGAQWRIEAGLEKTKMTGLQVEWGRPEGA